MVQEGQELLLTTASFRIVASRPRLADDPTPGASQGLDHPVALLIPWQLNKLMSRYRGRLACGEKIAEGAPEGEEVTNYSHNPHCYS